MTAFYDFFRKIVLAPDGVTLEADSTTDTLTITRGNGVAFNPTEATDSFEIDVDYTLDVPIGSTIVRLTDVNANESNITLTPGLGMDIIRKNANELYFEAYGVAEVDTLHTIAVRGPITPQKLFIGDLEIGSISSQAGTDGFLTYDGIFNGTGTQSQPLSLRQDSVIVTDPSFTQTYNFATVATPGFLTYSLGWDSDNVLSQGQVTLQRQDPDTLVWSTINTISDVGATMYRIDNSYSESDTRSINWRITYNFSGNTGQIDIFAQLIFEAFNITANPVLQTDTVNGNISLRDVTPMSDSTYSLGTTTESWAEAYVDQVMANVSLTVNDYTFPANDGQSGQILQTDGNGVISFVDTDVYGGNRVYVSALRGDDSFDGVSAPVATIKRAAQIASEMVYVPTTINSQVETQTTILRKNADFIATEVIEYINVTYPALVYDEDFCYRDTLEIIDSAIYDLRFGGNSRSVSAGKYYYDAQGALYITGQVAETIDAINYAKSLVQTVASNSAVSTIRGTLTQYIDDTSLTIDPTVSSNLASSFDIVTGIINGGLGAAPAIVYGEYKTKQITIMVATGEYIEQNPIIVPDNVSVTGDNLRRVIIRPANKNLDVFRVRNGSYVSGVTFRDALDVNDVPDFTFRFAISFDNVDDTKCSRAGYTNLPIQRSKIFTSPYVQNCTILSFLGGNGVEINGALIDAPNIPSASNYIEAENPVDTLDGIPEYGKSMVANAFTILSFGGTAWRVINDAYAQIVSCFVIFAGNGFITQNGGYLSITNSASNFGLFALRSSGYSPGAFDFAKGVISETGVSDGRQTVTAVGFEKPPIEHFIMRIHDADDFSDITDNFNSNLSLGSQSELDLAFGSASDTVITFNGLHGLSTGDIVEYDSNGNVEIFGLLNEMTYYVSEISGTQIQLYHDVDLTKVVDKLDTTTTNGIHYFNRGYEEFYVHEILTYHNEYQTLVLPAGTYTATPGDTINGDNGANPVLATIHSFDSDTNELVVSIEFVSVNNILVRNAFGPGSTIDAGEISAGVVTVTSATNRNDLYTSTFSIASTQNRAMPSIGNLVLNKLDLHRPSIVNSSAHTWEYAGSGTDYNALPQNGGQTIEFFEQVSTLPGRVYTSGTNELGDFKVGDFVRAYNRTGNIEFTNRVSIGVLDSLNLSLSQGVVVNEISTDIDLGDNEVGGAQHSRLVTQLAARTFLDNRLGNFIDQNLTTNAVPSGVVQLNSQGQINPELIPAAAYTGASAISVNTYNGRLELHEDIPSINLKSGDIVIEEYQQYSLTLDNPVTVVAGETIQQVATQASGVVKESVTNGTSIKLVEPFYSPNQSFDTVSSLVGSVSGSLGATPTSSVLATTSENYFLKTSNASQFLKLNEAETYDFTNLIATQTPVVSALTGAAGTPTAHVTGVLLSASITTPGSGYLTPGTYTNVSLTNISGSGTGALADIIVDASGVVDSVDIRRGGSGYTTSDVLSVDPTRIGGQGGTGTDLELDVLDVENRLYVDIDSDIGLTFNATIVTNDYIRDDNSPTQTQSQLTSITIGFDASSSGGSGNVDYATSRIIFGSAHGFSNGDPVIYDSQANPTIGGLSTGSTYYVKVINTTTIELYSTYSLVTQITFTSSASGIQQLRIDHVNIYADVIYLPAHGYNTGTPVRLSSTNLPQGLTQGAFYFIGSVTTNSFTLHEGRGSATDSVNGITVSPVNILTIDVGDISFTEQTVELIGTVNTSGESLSSWSVLTVQEIDAGDIISGIVSTSRLGTGTANNTTFLRGDGQWTTAVQGITNTVAGDPITLTGSSKTVGSTTTFYNNVDIRVENASYTNPVAPSSGTETRGVAAFAFDHFNINTTTGLVTTKTSGQGGVIDAASLNGQAGNYYLNPINLSRTVPIEKGGTNISTYAAGDLLYAATAIGNGSYSQSLSKLTIGANNRVLVVSGGLPTWSNTLNVSSITATTGNITTLTSTTGNITTANIGYLNLTDGDVSGQLIVGKSSATDTQGELIAYGTGRNMVILQTADNTADRGIAWRNSGAAYVGYINMENVGSNLADMVFGVDTTTQTDVNNVVERLRITTNGVVQVTGQLTTTGVATLNSLIVPTDATVSGGLDVTDGSNLTVKNAVGTAVTTINGTTGDITMSGALYGPAIFTIDPAGHGDYTGTVVIKGDLQIDGTTTTINSTTVTVDDKNIVLAAGSTSAIDSNGAGLTIELGTNGTAEMTYSNVTDAFEFNKPIVTPGGGHVVTFFQGATPPPEGLDGDEWYNTNDNILYKKIDGSWVQFHTFI